MQNNKEFVPYISADKITPELTATSVVTGIILSVIFGAANAYLGLKVGLTVSASIPAAVASMGIIRMAMKRNSVLESNIVQTMGSAGESVAAGAVFTLPALFLWAKEGKAQAPDIAGIILIALIGGLLGVFFMVPLRNALIVKEHSVLPYPEGTACAEVLLSGEKDKSNASGIFIGSGIAALIKILIDGIKLLPSEISFRFRSFAGEIGAQISPAVFSVGYICGPKISSYMFGGGILGWLVIIPLIVLFGENLTLFPSETPIDEMYINGGASAIWSSYIRYIGAGALASGGIISLIKSMPMIIRTFKDTLSDIGSKITSDKRTDKNISIRTVLIAVILLTVAVWLVPAIPISLIGAVIVVVFGFFFAAVSSRMVGFVGSSNNPVSGMAIATLLVATVVLKLSGAANPEILTSSIAIGSVICIIAAISGDTSQDLKTGYILGSTPRKQQIAEIIGVVASAFATGGTLYLLNNVWGFGTDNLAAPQATLMKIIVEGVADNNLPWNLVLIGVFITVVAEVTGIPVLPFAIGLYLPIHLSACVMLGGVVKFISDKIKPQSTKGTLFCSGMIAGEGLAGIFLALVAVFR
ncbi:MAG: oligopeptide transporter, OPT family [Acutalibacteraceae bacterium]|nr:oligopeptide transporter, OPT family [Acutalibacteraceae bacterium]